MSTLDINEDYERVGVHSYANFEKAYREHMDEYNIPFYERDIQSAWILFQHEPEAFCFLTLHNYDQEN